MLSTINICKQKRNDRDVQSFHSSDLILIEEYELSEQNIPGWPTTKLMQACYCGASYKPKPFSYNVDTCLDFCLYISLLDYFLVYFPSLFFLWYFGLWVNSTLHESASVSEPLFLHPFMDSHFFPEGELWLIFITHTKRL